ncbi:hypothetical protein Taro_019650 [Colocasia esculenta]|uniref:Transmembrane protein n=1 Tax=Colocasia esculenta TaxID=4460 RepID=A0A843UUC5_COLES|nr:hypothetical protein [Colocasia esculenta]
MQTSGPLAGVREVVSLQLVCGFPARFMCVLQWVVAVSLAWRVRSLSVFVSWWRAWCWLVVSSGEVLSEFFSVGSGGNFPKPFAVLLNGALVVLVEVLPGPVCFCSAACCSVLSVGLSCLVVGLCILVKVLPMIALCRFWRRFFLGVLCVHFGPPLCCPYGSKCAVWLGCVLERFSQDGSWHFWWRFSPKLLRVVLCSWPCVWLLRWPAFLISRFQVSRLCRWDFVCLHGSDGLLCFPVPSVLSHMMV